MENLKVSSDKSLLDINLIYSFLTNAYWSKGKSKEVVEESIKNSICFGIYLDDKQIGFARVISDKITLAYLLDVFIIEPHRGKGYSKILITYILNYPHLAKVKKWMLATSDAKGLYEKFGFHELKNPGSFMEKLTKK